MRRKWPVSTLACLFLAHFSFGARQPALDRPTLDAAQTWFTACRSWLDSNPEPASIPDKTPLKLAVPAEFQTLRFSAVAVVLRLDGRPVGEAWKAGPETSAISSALQLAFANASVDRRVASLPSDLLATLGSRLTIELELAGEPQPLTGQRLDLLASRVQPALEAFAFRNGDRWVFAMPSIVQSRNQSSVLKYLALLSARDIGIDFTGATDLQLPDGAAAYRVATRRFAQVAPSAKPFESIRGSRLVDRANIHAASMTTMATDLAHHLLQRWPTTESLDAEAARSIQALGPRALYQPSSGSWPQLVSNPADQSLAALAMAEASCAPWLSQEDRTAARAFAVSTLQALQTIEPEEIDPAADAQAISTIVLTVDVLDRQDTSWCSAEHRLWIAHLREVLIALAEKLEKPQSSLACVITAALGQNTPPSLRKAAWDAADPDCTLAATPWMLRNTTLVDPQAVRAAWVAALPALLETQWSIESPGHESADLDGGWARGSSTAGPTALSSRVALALAMALKHDGAIESDQRPEGVESLRRAMRRLRQLQVDHEASYAFRDPAKAHGGIRAAPWDSDEHMTATAYTLLAALHAHEVFAAAEAVASQP